MMGGAAYQTPDVHVLDVMVEGVLCSSLQDSAFKEFFEEEI